MSCSAYTESFGMHTIPELKSTLKNFLSSLEKVGIAAIDLR